MKYNDNSYVQKCNSCEWYYGDKTIDAPSHRTDDANPIEQCVYIELLAKIKKFYKIPSTLEARYGLSINELIQCIARGLSSKFETACDMRDYISQIMSKNEFKFKVLIQRDVVHRIEVSKAAKEATELLLDDHDK